MHKWSIAGACGALLLVVALILDLVLGGEVIAGDGNGEPLDAATKAQFQGTHLDFIAETGRIVVNEHGTRQIIWDPPQLPTVGESISMAARAAEVGDKSLLPLCTLEYLQYLRLQEAPRELTHESKTRMLPACNTIPDAIVFGPPSLPGPPNMPLSK